MQFGFERERVGGVALLEECVSDIPFIGEDVSDRINSPCGEAEPFGSVLPLSHCIWRVPISSIKRSVPLVPDGTGA